MRSCVLKCSECFGGRRRQWHPHCCVMRCDVWTLFQWNPARQNEVGDEKADALRLPSQFLLVSGVRVQGCVDEELIEDVPLEENKQNKCKPTSATLTLWLPLSSAAVDCALANLREPISILKKKNMDCRQPHCAVCLHTGRFEPFHTAALPHGLFGNTDFYLIQWCVAESDKSPNVKLVTS